MRQQLILLRLGIFIAILPTSSMAVAQHYDVLIQRQDNKIVIGAADFDQVSFTIGARVFSRDFDSDYEIDDPGFNSLSNTSPFIPAGYSALPVSSPVNWDFLPMKVETTIANLMYWNGLDTNENGVDVLDVSLGTSPGYTLSLAGVGGTVTADGTAQVKSGFLASTGSNGSMHQHRDYTLDDGDMNSGTNPVDGIYLVALQLRMDVLEASVPFFLVFGTPFSTLDARNAAVTWVQQRVDTLVFTGLIGDYNDDGSVDAADYVVWRKTLGQSDNLAADGNGNDEIDPGDYTVWTEHFGETQPPAGAGSEAVPEPATLLLLGLGIPWIASNYGRRHRT